MKVYVLRDTYWDTSDSRCNCLVYSTEEKALEKLDKEKQEVVDSWKTSKNHIIDGVVTDRIREYKNGFDVEELHYFLFGSRDWEFEYGYEVKELDFEIVKYAYNRCNYENRKDYIKDLKSIIDTDKYICCDFDFS